MLSMDDYMLKCKQCGTDNVITRSNCRKCGAELDKSMLVKPTFTEPTVVKPITQSHNVEDENRQYNQNETNYYESRKIENKVANKFKIVANILKFLGYGGAILCTIVIMANGEAGAGILGGIVIAIATWFGCLFWEAVAEGLQLLEDIKNK